MHFHIRWSNGKIDWETFNSELDAIAAAELALPGETYVVEQFDADCPQCSQLIQKAAG